MLLLLLAFGLGVRAQETGTPGAREQTANPSASRAEDANDADESWWRKWDVAAQDPNNPNDLMAAKWAAVLKVLQAKDLDPKLKEKILDRIVSPVFDFPLMGQLALGRTHWPKLNAAQRARFIQLFVARLKALYLEKTTLYTNEKIVLKPGVQKKNLVQIPMVLISEDKEIAIVYKLHKADEPSKSKAGGSHVPKDARGDPGLPWRIYDVEIEGVSILLTYRSQFDDILRQGTVEDLLSQLEKSPKQ